MSIQTGVPISDVTRTSLDAFREWHTNTGATTNLWATIDETILDISDYIINPTPPATYVAKLSTLVTPPTRDGHICWFTIQQDPGGIGTTEASDITIELRQGYVNESSLGTLIEGHTYSISTSTIPGTGRFMTRFNITNANASNITNYADLYLRVITDPHTEPDTFVLYDFYLTIPAPSAGTAGPSQFPTSPVFYGEVMTSGSVNGEPVTQLWNFSTNRKAFIYELGFWGGGADGGTTTLCRADLNSMRRTSNPLQVGLGGNTKTGNIICLQGTSTPVCILKGYDFTNSQFHELGLGVSCEFADQHFFEIRPGATAQDWPFAFRQILSYPLSLMPGSALELCWRFNAPNFVIRMSCLWSEILI